MELDEKVAESVSIMGNIFRGAGIKWTDAEAERLKVVIEYSALDKPFRKKFLENPRKVFDDIGILIPKNFVILAKERTENSAPEITFVLPDYVGSQ